MKTLTKKNYLFLLVFLSITLMTSMFAQSYAVKKETFVKQSSSSNVLRYKIMLKSSQLKRGMNQIGVVRGKEIYINYFDGRILGWKVISLQGKIMQKKPTKSKKKTTVYKNCKLCVDIYVDGKFVHRKCAWVDCSLIFGS